MIIMEMLTGFPKVPVNDTKKRNYITFIVVKIV